MIIILNIKYLFPKDIPAITMNNVTIMFLYYPIKRNILVWMQSIMENKQIKSKNYFHSLQRQGRKILVTTLPF